VFVRIKVTGVWRYSKNDMLMMEQGAGWNCSFDFFLLISCSSDFTISSSERIQNDGLTIPGFHI
jgi:hypothetical protein